MPVEGMMGMAKNSGSRLWIRVLLLVLVSAAATFGVFYAYLAVMQLEVSSEELILLYTVVFPALAGGIAMLFTVLGTPFYLSWIPYPLLYAALAYFAEINDGFVYLYPDPVAARWNGWILPASIVGALLGLLLYKLFKLDEPEAAAPAAAQPSQGGAAYAGGYGAAAGPGMYAAAPDAQQATAYGQPAGYAQNPAAGYAYGQPGAAPQQGTQAGPGAQQAGMGAQQAGMNVQPQAAYMPNYAQPGQQASGGPGQTANVGYSANPQPGAGYAYGHPPGYGNAGRAMGQNPQGQPIPMSQGGQPMPTAGGQPIQMAQPGPNAMAQGGQSIRMAQSPGQAGMGMQQPGAGQPIGAATATPNMTRQPVPPNAQMNNPYAAQPMAGGTRQPGMQPGSGMNAAQPGPMAQGNPAAGRGAHGQPGQAGPSPYGQQPYAYPPQVQQPGAAAYPQQAQPGQSQPGQTAQPGQAQPGQAQQAAPGYWQPPRQ